MRLLIALVLYSAKDFALAMNLTTDRRLASALVDSQQGESLKKSDANVSEHGIALLRS